MGTLKPPNEDTQYAWAQLETLGAVEAGSELDRRLAVLLDTGDGHYEEIRGALWRVFATWYEAGRLNPRPIKTPKKEARLDGKGRAVRRVA